MARAVLNTDMGQPAARHDLWWTVIGALGWAFVLAGGSDLVLAWIPPQLGNPEWEFGTVSASLDAMPLPSMGLAFILARAVVRRDRLMVRGVAVTFCVLAVILVGWAALYALAAPVGLQSVPEGPVRLGLQKAIAKAVVQAIVYPAVFGWVGWKAFRFAV